jgi:hypothetical protein
MAAKTAFDRFVGSVSSGRSWRYRPTTMVAYSVRFIFYWFDLCSYVIESLVEPGNSKKIMPPKVKASVIPLAKPLMNEETEQQDNMNTYV